MTAKLKNKTTAELHALIETMDQKFAVFTLLAESASDNHLAADIATYCKQAVGDLIRLKNEYNA